MTEPDDPIDPTDPDDGDDVRRLLRGLPDVAPPEGFYDGLIRRRHRRARTVVVVGLVAAGVVGALVVADASGITGEAEPQMAALAARHATMMTSEVDGGMDEMPAPYQVPDHLGSLQAGIALRHDDDVVQIVYGEGGHYLSVFEEAGDFEDDAMDLALTPLHVRGVAAWQADDGSIIVRRSDVVYVLIGDIDPDEVTEIIDDLPNARPMGLASRIGDAMDELVDAFGLG